jgi:hypothetical protein
MGRTKKMNADQGSITSPSGGFISCSLASHKFDVVILPFLWVLTRVFVDHAIRTVISHAGYICRSQSGNDGTEFEDLACASETPPSKRHTVGICSS